MRWPGLLADVAKILQKLKNFCGAPIILSSIMIFIELIGGICRMNLFSNIFEALIAALLGLKPVPVRVKSSGRR